MSKSVEKRLKVQLKEKMTRLKADTIREDGRLERHCEHGVGHTVGDVRKPGPHLNERYFYAHGCCGGRCCGSWEVEEWKDIMNPLRLVLENFMGHRITDIDCTLFNSVLRPSILL